MLPHYFKLLHVIPPHLETPPQEVSSFEPTSAEEGSQIASHTSPHSDNESQKAELDANGAFIELPDPRDEKSEMPVIERPGKLDTKVPVESELETPQVWEMEARESVGSEMSTPIEERGRSPGSGLRVR